MRHLVDRTYRLSPEEAKQALCFWLRQRDRPVPSDQDQMKVQWTGEGEVVLSFSEQIEAD